LLELQKKVQFPLRLHMNDTMIILNRDTKLYPHHVDRHQKYDCSQPIAAVTQYSPDDPNLWWLKNISSENWVLTLPDMSTQLVGVNEYAALVVGSKISFGQSEGTAMGSE
jgi:eukaryotic-like serine/threonine-protein kinase